MPYLYTAVEAATRTGMPVLRPLFLDFPAEVRSHLVDDEAMFGPQLLVAPVVRAGRESRAVYLPPGAWFDVRDGRRFAGSRDHLVSATLDEDIPLLARAGSIIPMAPVTRSTRERPDRLVLEVWLSPGGRAEGELYEDDGESMAHVDGAWARTTFSARRDGGATVVRATRTGAFAPGPRRVEIIVRGGVRGPGGRDGDRAGRVASTVTEDSAMWEATVV